LRTPQLYLSNLRVVLQINRAELSIHYFNLSNFSKVET
jgi:hypothetical protein